MIETGIKILVVIGLIYTHLEAYKMGKIQGQRDYFHFFNVEKIPTNTDVKNGTM